MKLTKTTYKTIEPLIQHNVCSHDMIVDSFWEDHILKANHYGIYDGELIGYFTIFEQNTITSFYMKDEYIQHGKEVFSQIRRFEQVTNAMVPTGDEFFVSHCLDNFSRIEKQAYFSIYRSTPPDGFTGKTIQLKRITDREDLPLLKQAKDFFDNDPVETILDKSSHYRIYQALDHDELVGFGIVETGRVDPSIASIGMYVLEEKRQQGYAKNILRHLYDEMAREGYTRIRSGCWYYNHSSLKSIESAGGYSKTRLLRFYF